MIKDMVRYEIFLLIFADGFDNHRYSEQTSEAEARHSVSSQIESVPLSDTQLKLADFFLFWKHFPPSNPFTLFLKITYFHTVR